MENPKKEIQCISKPQDYTFVKEYYDSADASHFWIQWRLAAFLNQARASGLVNLDEPLRGLEVGCGHGILSQQIEAISSWTVDGVDIDKQALERNTAGQGDVYYYDILEKKETFKEKYEFLFLYDVLEHIDDTTAFLEACLFHLKKGGLFFINVPALKSLFSAYDSAQGHFRRYNKKLLQKQLEKTDSKIEVVDLRYWGFLLVPLLYIRKLTLSKNQSNEQIIKKGFKPPSKLFNNILKAFMKFETTLLKSPPCGTSLMTLCRKR